MRRILRPQRINFDARLNGVPVDDWQELNPEDKITYSSSFEIREAARFVLISWTEFERLSPIEKANIIAHYRTRGKIDSAREIKNRRKQ